MEFVQFIIGTLKDFYPDPLNYILVFEMPWVLNGKFHFTFKDFFYQINIYVY